MKKINDKKYTEYKDIHGNTYLDNEDCSDGKINGQQTCDFIASDISVCRPTGYNKDDLITKNHVAALSDKDWLVKVCGKDIEAMCIQNVIDRKTQRCDLISFMPRYNKQDGLCDPFNFDGVPIRLAPDMTCIHINSVPIIENGNIKEFQFYPSIRTDGPWESLEWAMQEKGSIERVLYDSAIGDKALVKFHRIALSNGRIIHSYFDVYDGGRQYIDIYELTSKKENGKTTFSTKKIVSTQVHNKIDEMAAVGNQLYTYSDKTGSVIVYEISDNKVYPLARYVGCYNLQDFLNRANLNIGKELSRDDYAKMEKAYIERKAKDANDIGKNNTSSDMSLKNKEQGVGNGKGGAK